MRDINTSVLVKLIKAEKKGPLLWERDPEKGEMITNGQWAVVIDDEILELKIRLALYSIFEREIDRGESIAIVFEEIKEGENIFRGMKYEPFYAKSIASLTPIVLNGTFDNPAARLLNVGTHVVGIPLEYDQLSSASSAYQDASSEYSPVYFGDSKNVMINLVHPKRATWGDLIRKYANPALRVNELEPAGTDE